MVGVAGLSIISTDAAHMATCFFVEFQYSISGRRI